MRTHSRWWSQGSDPGSLIPEPECEATMPSAVLLSRGFKRLRDCGGYLLQPVDVHFMEECPQLIKS